MNIVLDNIIPVWVREGRHALVLHEYADGYMFNSYEVRNLATCRLCSGVFFSSGQRWCLRTNIRFCWVLHIWIIVARDIYIVHDEMRHILNLDRDIDDSNNFPVCDTCIDIDVPKQFTRVMTDDFEWCGPEKWAWMRPLFSIYGEWDCAYDGHIQDISENSHRDLREKCGGILRL